MGEGREVSQTRLYSSRVSTALLPSKPQTWVAGSCLHTRMSSQMGPTSAGSNKGPPGRLREGGCTQSLRRRCLYWLSLDLLVQLSLSVKCERGSISCHTETLLSLLSIASSFWSFLRLALCQNIKWKAVWGMGRGETLSSYLGISLQTSKHCQVYSDGL